MKNILFILLFFVSANLLTAQTNLTGSFIHGGIERTYKIYVPAMYDGNTPFPVVFSLHGMIVTADIQDQVADFKPIADTAGFILVTPNGAVASGYQNWNTGFSSSPADDVDFLETLIDTIAAGFTIDRRKVYATGYSNGGFLSYLLACQSDRFAAVASVAGTMMDYFYETCIPANTVPIMHIHGTNDNIIAFNGNITMASAEAMIDKFVEINQCDTLPVVDTVADINTSDGVFAVHYSYASAGNTPVVEFYKIIGGGHTWPGSTFYLPFGDFCMDFNACEQMWRFFKQFESANYSGIHPEAIQDLTIWPNPASDVLNIKVKNKMLFSLQILNLQGQIIMNFSGNDISHLAVGKLPQGIYIIRTKTPFGDVFSKFIKE